MTRIRLALIALLAAGLLTSCSTGGTAAPASTTSTSTTSSTSTSTTPSSASTTETSSSTESSISTDSSTTDSATSETTQTTDTTESTDTTDTSTDDTTTASSGPVKLDADSSAWFSGICQGQKKLQALAGPSTSGTVKQVQLQVVAAYSKLSTASGEVAEDLAALAPPTLPDGAEKKRDQVGAFQAIAKGYASGAATIKAGSYASYTEIKAAITKVESGVQTAVKAAVAGATDYPAGYAEAIKALPACQGLK